MIVVNLMDLIGLAVVGLILLVVVADRVLAKLKRTFRS